MRRHFFVLLLAVLVSLPSAAAWAQPDGVNDPLEPMNRAFFNFDMFLDRIMLKPVAQLYVAVIPDPGRRAISNVLSNMNEPIVFANDMLQGEFHRADITVGRFLLNSTFGLGGIIDWASSSGLPRQSGDFGQTLYVWGVPSGPYLVLPFLGPTNPRDAIGFGVDSFADPIGYAFWNAGGLQWAAFARAGTDTINSRSQQIDSLDELQRTAIDFYAEVRSLARQRRAIELRHGKAPPIPAFESFDEEQSGTGTQASAQTVKPTATH